jgi:DNA-directed RNA polymerase specialized sigma24 family protein
VQPTEPNREERLVELHRAGALAECAAEALKLYGAELEGFVRAAAAPRLDPDEAWAATCAALVEGLGRFAWRSTLRTWLYRVARYTLRDLGARAARQPNVPLSQVSRPSKLEARVSQPPSWLGEAAEARLLELRESLEDDERTLLYLRVEQAWAWRDIAAAVADEGADLDREAAALRKRFERLKARIRDVLERAREGARRG